jgi:hypothetical protein
VRMPIADDETIGSNLFGSIEPFGRTCRLGQL